MDRNYIRNRVAFELMDTLGLFRLFYSFGELVLNGSTEGIYMMLERPQDWALKTKDSPLILRRGFDHKVEKIKTGKKIDKSEIKSYRSTFSNIYKNLNKFQGAELYSKLTQWIDIEMYMQWLAFNYFVHNGDYTDEVYFYIDPNDNRFKIIPWDYDDIFAREPHEGMKQKKSNIKDKLLFSSEDRLDQKIASDPFLYNKYLEQLQAVLDALNPQIVAGVFQNTFAELYPFYLRGDIMAISRNDTYKEAGLETLQDDLHRTYQQLMIFRTSNLDIIARTL
jgi:spore coat protein H